MVEYAALTKTPGMELRIGDLVQCRDNHYNQGLGIVHKIGMIAELRRNVAVVAVIPAAKLTRNAPAVLAEVATFCSSCSWLGMYSAKVGNRRTSHSCTL